MRGDKWVARGTEMKRQQHPGTREWRLGGPDFNDSNVRLFGISPLPATFNTGVQFGSISFSRGAKVNAERLLLLSVKSLLQHYRVRLTGSNVPIAGAHGECGNGIVKIWAKLDRPDSEVTVLSILLGRGAG